MAKHRFTPKMPDGSRAEMLLNDADDAKIGRGCRWSAEVTDLKTGRRYKVRGAACNIPRCMCDAVVVKIL